MEEICAITIVKNRITELLRLIQFLEAGKLKPKELIVVWMAGPSDYSLIKSENFSIRHFFISGGDLPIAKARNKGFKEAKCENIIYMNVDSIFNENLLADVAATLTSGKIITTYIKYISQSAADSDLDNLDHDIQLPVASEPLSNTSRDSEYCQVFGIRKADFNNIGGFDESYDGFGINDEDFITAARFHGIKIHRLDTIVFTKLRDNYRCPLNHLLDFSRNAEIYRRKWQRYPCEPVLNRYAAEGYINPDYAEQGIRILALPEEIRSQQIFYNHSDSSDSSRYGRE